MKESDIRPADLHAEYLRLSALDATKFFNDSSTWSSISCPGCSAVTTAFSFTKLGFDYRECKECGSLFQSPRPPAAAFGEFYGHSQSSEYWANTFFAAVAEPRRKMIFGPRAEHALQLAALRGLQTRTVIDVGAGHGIFLEEFRKISPQSRVMAIEPGQELAAICRRKGLEVLQTGVEQAVAWHGTADLVTCFEVIEHAHTPLDFVSAIRQLLKPDGYAIVSGLGGDGFDIQCLWQNSKAVSPPHHLNFLSVTGFEALFKRAGFSSVEVLTPGKLDVDIVLNYIRETPDHQLPRFITTLLSRGPVAIKELQEFLSKYQLSSHTWIVARR